MSRASLAAMIASLAAYTHDVNIHLLRGRDPSPAYRPKRAKIKGHQKSKKRGRK